MTEAPARTKVLAIAVSVRFALEVPESVTHAQAEQVVAGRIQAVVPPDVVAEIVALSVKRVPRVGDTVEALHDAKHVEYAQVVEIDGELQVQFADGLRLPVPDVPV